MLSPDVMSGDFGALWRALTPFGPVLGGSLPLGIDRVDSDLDILCQSEDHFAIHAALRKVLGPDHPIEDWAPRVQPPAHVYTFSYCGLTIEVFVQDVLAQRQVAFRHMLIEGRLLKLGGPEFVADIRRLKEEGRSTEAAFAEALGLDGEDPYRAVLQLEGLGDETLQEVLQARPEYLWGE